MQIYTPQHHSFRKNASIWLHFALGWRFRQGKAYYPQHREAAPLVLPSLVRPMPKQSDKNATNNRHPIPHG